MLLSIFNEELEDEKEPNNENHKSKESKEVKNEQLGYITSRSQMKNIFPKNINDMEASIWNFNIYKNS